MENASVSRALKLDKRQSKKRRSDKMKLRISRGSERGGSLSMAALLWTRRRRRVSGRASEAYQGIKLCAATSAARERSKEGRRDQPTLRSPRVQFSMHPPRPPPPVKKGETEAEGPFLRSTKRATCPPPSAASAPPPSAAMLHPKLQICQLFHLQAGNIASSGDVPQHGQDLSIYRFRSKRGRNNSAREKLRLPV